MAVVNETLARAWHGEDPIGKRLRLGNASADEPWVTVVGVVGDAILDFHKATLPGIYLPCTQNPERTMMFVVRILTPPLGRNRAL